VINENEKKEALQNYTACTQLADKWLLKLDSSDYQHLLTLKITDENKVKNIKDSVLIYINKVQKTYGRINSRKFIGAHMWSGKKLITYMPDIEEKVLIRTNMERSEDGFYIVNPKYFGLASAGQMFASLPEGKYVVLMYRSVPTNKSYAEEALILQYNPSASWEVFTYEISDDI
jgi:hypothetical protein